MTETPPTTSEIITKAVLRAIPYAGSSLAGIYDDIRERHAARINEVVSDVVGDVGEKSLAYAISTNEEVELLFLNTINLASSTAYKAKRNLLAKVISSAVSDQASIQNGNLIFYALKNLDEPHIRALARIRHAEDLATQALSPDESDKEGKVSSAVIEAGRREPVPVIAALIQAGVVEPATLWGGGIAAARLSDFGRHLLADLELESDK